MTTAYEYEGGVEVLIVFLDVFNIEIACFLIVSRVEVE